MAHVKRCASRNPQHLGGIEIKMKLLETSVIQVNAAVRYLSQLNLIRVKPMRELSVFHLRQMNLKPKVK